MNRHLRSAIAALRAFEPRHDRSDRIWEFYLQGRKRRWQHLKVLQHDRHYHLTSSEWDPVSTEGAGTLAPDTIAALRTLPSQLRTVGRAAGGDPIGYHWWLNTSVAPDLRWGVVPRALLHTLLPEWMRFDRELRPSELRAAIEWIFNTPDASLDQMTAGRYFDYCRIAYLANGRRSHRGLDIRQSGFKLYDRWADGRDGGLKTIDRNSPSAFERWYESTDRAGAHPWEIYRGGNATHIDMAVTRSTGARPWKVTLSAYASTRLVETCRILLALRKARLPVDLHDRESYALRLMGLDWIGVVPRHYSLSYAWHEFPREWQVSDCIRYSWLAEAARERGDRGRSSRKFRGLVSWLALPVVRLT